MHYRDGLCWGGAQDVQEARFVKRSKHSWPDWIKQTKRGVQGRGVSGLQDMCIQDREFHIALSYRYKSRLHLLKVH